MIPKLSLLFICMLAVPRLFASDLLQSGPSLAIDEPPSPHSVPLFEAGEATPICFSKQDKDPIYFAVSAFAEDVKRVGGVKPSVLSSSPLKSRNIIVIGTIDHSLLIKQLAAEQKIDVSEVRGKWESAIVEIVNHPFPGVERALVIAGSDPRGAAFSLLDMSRAIGVSPWNWWADVPVRHHNSAAVTKRRYILQAPAVQYRGIFINDEDWGIRPWAAKKMDPELNNIGPHTYARVFELLLRLHANTLWPAMHPGTLAFNSVPENARLASRWGIVMGSSHSEALLRNNVGEWNVKRDGPWNYQTNRDAIFRYWDERASENGSYENFYTVGMRGLHDSGLEADGSIDVKARLVEQVMADQGKILARRVNPDLTSVPQVIWLYKESIDLYRAGMSIPDYVTLGWTDDNYGYIRQLPNAAERDRAGGSALYYHISYWGAPHDYLWLCTTPPALMREELTKAWDHGVRKLWILNVGDIKPAEQDIDYFLQMAWRVPELRSTGQREYLQAWYAEQFPCKFVETITELMEKYYHLSFIRKPEFMGFNGYTDGIRRTAFNPLEWGDQNRQMLQAWEQLNNTAKTLEYQIPLEYRDAYFELVGYPVRAAGAHARKLLWTDRTLLDQHDEMAVRHDSLEAKDGYDQVQRLTTKYNEIAGGKWEGMMSSHPRNRHVFEMPILADHLKIDPEPEPQDWGAGSFSPPTSEPVTGFVEQKGTVSLDATSFHSKKESDEGSWQVWPDLGLSKGSISIANPGKNKEARWTSELERSALKSMQSAPALEYEFTTTTNGSPICLIYLLPTFPIDSGQRLRYGISIDDKPPISLDAAGAEGHKPGLSNWESNVLRNAMVQSVQLGELPAGKHSLRLIYGEPGVVFEHLTIVFPGAPPAYPFPPETWIQPSNDSSIGDMHGSL